MKTLVKLAAAAALAGSFAATIAAPAEAGVAVSVGIGGPGPRAHWCYNHPGACRRPGVVVTAPVYADGYFLAGHGYWHAHRWYGHRAWLGGRWVYR